MNGHLWGPWSLFILQQEHSQTHVPKRLNQVSSSSWKKKPPPPVHSRVSETVAQCLHNTFPSRQHALLCMIFSFRGSAGRNAHFAATTAGAFGQREPHGSPLPEQPLFPWCTPPCPDFTGQPIKALSFPWRIPATLPLTAVSHLRAPH